MTDVVDTLIERNATFAATRFSAELTMMPSRRLMIIGCVDPRVDPGVLFGLEPGEAAVIRNVGGRIFPSTMQTLGLLGIVSKTMGAPVGSGWNLVVLHHTDCGINCLVHAPEPLAKHFGVAPTELEALEITSPQAAVAVDIAKLRANPQLPAEVIVTGMVYDVATGMVATVVPSAPLRES